jgi:hypothetical protein
LIEIEQSDPNFIELRAVQPHLPLHLKELVIHPIDARIDPVESRVHLDPKVSICCRSCASSSRIISSVKAQCPAKF